MSERVLINRRAYKVPATYVDKKSMPKHAIVPIMEFGLLGSKSTFQPYYEPKTGSIYFIAKVGTGIEMIDLTTYLGLIDYEGAKDF